VKIEQIDARRMSHGVGVLRGVLSRPDVAIAAPDEVEAAIDHIRAAARLVERLQRQLSPPRRARRAAPRR
jgi:hypothetical protein